MKYQQEKVHRKKYYYFSCNNTLLRYAIWNCMQAVWKDSFENKYWKRNDIEKHCILCKVSHCFFFIWLIFIYFNICNHSSRTKRLVSCSQQEFTKKDFFSLGKTQWGKDMRRSQYSPGIRQKCDMHFFIWESKSKILYLDGILSWSWHQLLFPHVGCAQQALFSAVLYASCSFKSRISLVLSSCWCLMKQYYNHI